MTVGGASHRHQLAPVTGQRLLNPGGRGDEDVRLASFDLLDGADVQVGQFRHFLLGHVASGTQSADIGTKGLKLFLE